MSVRRSTRPINPIGKFGALVAGSLILYGHACIQSEVCPDNGCFPSPCAKAESMGTVYHCVTSSTHCCQCTGTQYRCRNAGELCADTYIDWTAITHYEDSSQCGSGDTCVID